MDPGYGNFKFAFIDPEKRRIRLEKAPSAVSEIPDWQAELQRDVAESAALEWKGKRYLVGNEAMLGGLPIPPFSAGWLEELACPLFARRYLTHGDRLYVLVSPADWDLRGKIAEGLREAGFDNVTFLAQGTGIWIEGGAPPEAAVIDIGFNTVDVLMAREGKLVRELSFSLRECGLVSFLERVARDDPFRITRRLEEGDERLTKLAKEHYWEWLERQLSARSEWRRMGKSARLVFGGGGARFVPEMENAVIVREPELANVRGVARSILKKLKRAGENASLTPTNR